VTRGRRLSAEEIEALLELDVPARLATIDPSGYPRITPLWFVWADGAFVMTSLDGRPHLRNLARDPRAAVCVDTEERAAVAGVRANRQVKGSGPAELFRDEGGAWTARITRKYVPGAAGEEEARRRTALPRMGVRLRPERLIALGTDPA
jgi:hypothetical protein